jgi:hypothetical protein
MTIVADKTRVRLPLQEKRNLACTTSRKKSTADTHARDKTCKGWVLGIGTVADIVPSLKRAAMIYYIPVVAFVLLNGYTSMDL